VSVSRLRFAAALAVALAACDPYPRDAFGQAAVALAPACFGTMAGFWIPPERCPDAVHAWEAGVAEFGPPSKPVRVTARAVPWTSGDKTVAGVFYCDAGLAVVAADLTWCQSSLIHELVHATRCAVPRTIEKHHIGWGNPQRHEPGSLFWRIEQTKARCAQ
jgi:hypothetical protein